MCFIADKPTIDTQLNAYVYFYTVCMSKCLHTVSVGGFICWLFNGMMNGLTAWWLATKIVWWIDWWHHALHICHNPAKIHTHTHTLLQCELLPRILNIRVYTRVRVLSKTTPYTFTVHIYWNLNDPGCFFSRIELLILIFFFRPMDQGTFGFQVYIQSPSTNPTTMGFLFR